MSTGLYWPVRHSRHPNFREITYHPLLAWPLMHLSRSCKAAISLSCGHTTMGVTELARRPLYPHLILFVIYESSVQHMRTPGKLPNFNDMRLGTIASHVP